MKKVVVITGITGTLGSAFATLYADKYKIVGIARRPPEKIKNIDFMAYDIGTNSYDFIVERILSTHQRIDVLINSAVYSRWNHISEASHSDFIHQLTVNVAAPLGLSNACYHQFWSQRPSGENNDHARGVINVGSIAGVNHYFGYGQATYAASKAALHTLTSHMASDYKAFGLKVNGIAPNSFPSLVDTTHVCENINSLMEADYTGRILVLDRTKNYFL